MDAKDIELVAQVTKEQEQWKATIYQSEKQVMRLLTALAKGLSIVDPWWLDVAKQQLLLGMAAATKAVSVPLTEKNLTAIKDQRELVAARAALDKAAANEQAQLDAEVAETVSEDAVESPTETNSTT